MTQQNSTNKYATAKFIVAPTLAEGATHTTIAGALADASEDDVIFLKPGDYTEDITLTDNIAIVAYDAGATFLDQSAPEIIGKITCNLSANKHASITGVKITTNSDYAISFTGSNFNQLTLKNCFVLAEDNDAILFSNSSASSILLLERTPVDLNGAYKAFDMTATGFLGIKYSSWGNNNSTTTASTQSAGVVRVEYSEIRSPITTSGTAVFESVHSYFRMENLNATALTVGGTGATGNYVDSCYFTTGTASSISVGATLALSDSTVVSSNTNPITGAGTLNYSNVSYQGTGVVTNTSTQSGNITDLGQFLARSQPCFSAYRSTAADNVTGNGTVYTVVFDTERYDQGSDYDNSTGVFTAPVAGKYLLCATVKVKDVTAGTTSLTYKFTTSNSEYVFATVDPSGFDISAGSGIVSLNGSVIADMDASDTAQVDIVGSGSGTDDLDVDGGTSGNVFFMGSLIC